VRQVIATDLGAERVAIARHAPQGDPEKHFGHATAVKRRSVDEVEAAIEGDLDRLQGFVEGDAAELLAERRSAKAEDREIDPGFAEGAGFHRKIIRLGGSRWSGASCPRGLDRRFESSAHDLATRRLYKNPI